MCVGGEGGGACVCVCVGGRVDIYNPAGIWCENDVVLTTGA